MLKRTGGIGKNETIVDDSVVRQSAACQSHPQGIYSMMVVVILVVVIGVAQQQGLHFLIQDVIQDSMRQGCPDIGTIGTTGTDHEVHQKRHRTGTHVWKQFVGVGGAVAPLLIILNRPDASVYFVCGAVVRVRVHPM
jgi:hypothetical protein